MTPSKRPFLARTIAAAALASFACLATAAPSLAAQQRKPAAEAAGGSDVAVIVNDVPITRLDVTRRARLLMLAHEKKSAIDDLIDDTLKVQEAALRNIRVDVHSVDTAIAGIARNIKQTPESLAAALAKAGSDIETLRKRIGAQQAFAQIVRARMQGNVQKAQADKQSAAALAGEVTEKTVNDYSLRRVVLTLPANPPPAAVSRRMAEAQELRRQFTSCDSGTETVRKYAASVFVPIGHRLNSDIPEKETAMLDSVPIGGLSPPERTGAGIEMIAVCNRFPHTIKVTPGAKGLSDDELNAEGQQIADTLVREARQRAIIVYPR